MPTSRRKRPACYEPVATKSGAEYECVTLRCGMALECWLASSDQIKHWTLMRSLILIRLMRRKIEADNLSKQSRQNS